LFHLSIFFSFSGIPRDISFTVVQETFNSVDGIIAVHNLRIWGLTTDKTALAAHLVIGKYFQLMFFFIVVCFRKSR
jgi:cobalt-zinc-cadmium efflux system protein